MAAQGTVKQKQDFAHGMVQDRSRLCQGKLQDKDSGWFKGIEALKKIASQKHHEVL